VTYKNKSNTCKSLNYAIFNVEITTFEYLNNDIRAFVSIFLKVFLNFEKKIDMVEN